jgi:hypothetical protein
MEDRTNETNRKIRWLAKANGLCVMSIKQIFFTLSLLFLASTITATVLIVNVAEAAEATSEAVDPKQTPVEEAEPECD